MACCWRVTPLDSVAIRARTLAAEVAQKEDLLAVLAESTLDCSAGKPQGHQQHWQPAQPHGQEGPSESEGEPLAHMDSG